MELSRDFSQDANPFHEAAVTLLATAPEPRVRAAVPASGWVTVLVLVLEVALPLLFERCAQLSKPGVAARWARALNGPPPPLYRLVRWARWQLARDALDDALWDARREVARRVERGLVRAVGVSEADVATVRLSALSQLVVDAAGRIGPETLDQACAVLARKAAELAREGAMP